MVRMSTGDVDDFDDPHDDDILGIISKHDKITDPLGSNSSCRRPHKRRRLRDAGPYYDNDSASDASLATDSLPDPRPVKSAGYKGTESSKSAGSKHRIYQPKYPTMMEDTFVTQLTQPLSSPSRIRGARWKKPEPEIITTNVVCPASLGHQNAVEEKQGQGCDGDDATTAIVASLESIPEEGRACVRVESPVHPEREWKMGPSCDVPSLQDAPRPESPFDLEDIPEDAFDSSPDSGSGSIWEEPIPISSQPLPARSRSRSRVPSTQANLRQTTLFGGTAQETGTLSQSTPRSWPLANKNELPTHHKLNTDALETWVYPRNLGKRRDYQFNITKIGLFHNLLVALPTGLGKTFIAATVMLNWFRWTKDAQIVFVAPTKPLVSQQVAACFDIVGIPRSQTTMLTGGAPPGVRAEEWQCKRVFFMTPQTLINDLKTGIADPKRIVLLVVDEAHRATGGYAYVGVVEFIRRFNKSFRVLALTATPGASVETVQEVIDGLDIARVEIRTEQSLDIREFVHVREVELQTFDNSAEMVMALDLFSKALQPAVDKLRSRNAYWAKDPMSLTPYGLTMARQQWMASAAGKHASWPVKSMVNSTFSVLASLAHATDLLKYHGIGPFFRNLRSFQSSVAEGGKGSQCQRQIAENDNFKTLLSKLRTWTSDGDFVGHPKLEYLRQVVLNHFMDAGGGISRANGRSASDTRIMIFVHFRDSAEEIARVLKRYEPMVRSHVFVGQASTKGSDGMNQKTQLRIIEKFKAGAYNTIIATSIGEEGLDIGEVDLIVCYDSSSSPIRMLQRMGRTGRKRKGNIVLLLMKGKEEDSYSKAKDNYEKMQQLIASGSRFTFHDARSSRILPREVRPEVDERLVEIPLENSQAELPEPRRRDRAPKRPPKKFHMPDGVDTGFTKASRINRKKRGDGASEPVEAPVRNDHSSISEPAELPPLSDVLLSPAEQGELEQRYCNIGGSTPQFIHRPRSDAFPKLHRSYRPTKLVKHSRVTSRMVKVFQRMVAIGPGCEDLFKAHLHPDDAKSIRYPRSVGIGLPSPGRLPNAPENSSFPGATDSCPSYGLDLEPFSSLMCSQSSLPRPKEQPFYVSQISQEDLDIDIDLPDIDTLVNQVSPGWNMESNCGLEAMGSSNFRRAKRRKRVIVGDDSDDL